MASRALTYHQANQANADWCKQELHAQGEWWRKWRRYFSDQRLAGLVQDIHESTLKRRSLLARVELTKDAGTNAYATAIFQLREHLIETRKLMGRIEMRLEGVTPVVNTGRAAFTPSLN